MNDLPPGIRGVNKVPQVVISDNDPICFFSEVEQEPDRHRVDNYTFRTFPMPDYWRHVPGLAAHRGDSTSEYLLCRRYS